MAHQEYEELLTLYALDALDAPDRRQLEEHLESCSDCRAELAEMRDAAGLLAHASTAAEPRAEVRERILASIRADRSSAKPTEVGNVVPITPRRKVSVANYLLRIAAVIAFGGVVIWLVSALLVKNHEIASLTSEIEVKRRELEHERREAQRREAEALALLNPRGTKRMELAGTAQAQNARAVFIFDQKSGKAVLMTDGLPSPPPGMAYEVWFIPQGQAPMPGKTFTVDAAGKAMMMDEMPAAARENAVVAITLEPEKGSASPTGPIYLASPAS